MTNPLLKRKNFFLYLAFWFVIAVFQYFSIRTTLNISEEFALIDVIVFNLVYFGFGLGFWYSALFISLENNSLTKIIIKHTLAACLSSVLWILVSLFLIYLFKSINRDYLLFFKDMLVLRFVMGIFFYGSLVFLYYVIIFYNALQAKLYKEAELNALRQEAELKALKYQLNPHFIFNSLNSISSLTISDPAKAREMIIKLSNFMRSTISGSEKQKNKLYEELKLIQLYMEIERIRFEDKFIYIEEIPENCLNHLVPHMILQPLFENAIKHGVYESLDKVEIRLKCSIENNYLKIIIENNFDEENPNSKGKKVGLQNVMNRLNLIYNQDNLLVTEKKDNLFRVILYIPI